jgi:hypothetical protein
MTDENRAAAVALEEIAGALPGLRDGLGHVGELAAVMSRWALALLDGEEMDVSTRQQMRPALLRGMECGRSVLAAQAHIERLVTKALASAHALRDQPEERSELARVAASVPARLRTQAVHIPTFLNGYASWLEIAGIVTKCNLQLLAGQEVEDRAAMVSASSGLLEQLQSAAQTVDAVGATVRRDAADALALASELEAAGLGS